MLCIALGLLEQKITAASTKEVTMTPAQVAGCVYEAGIDVW